MIDILVIIILGITGIALLILSIGLLLMIYQELVDSGLVEPFKRKKNE